MDGTKYWIALNDVQGMGTAHLKELHEAVEKAGIAVSDLFGLTASELKGEFSLSERSANAVPEAEKFLSGVEENYFRILDAGIEVVTFFSSSYPERLHSLLGSSAPALLYVYGNREILSTAGAAILGEKNISSRGEFISYMASRELAKHDITVISGFAGGAGTAAHRAALEGGGKTAAFVPYGILNLTLPPGIEHLFDPDRAVVVSVFRPSDGADKYHAFNRNRVICALARAVYVVEAPESGGIFEAAKSASGLKVPLYTTEYSEYPESAAGNGKIISELGGRPVRGRRMDDLTVPNMDRIIADVKFK